MQKPEIRLMRPEDYDAVYALWTSCRGMGLNRPDDSREGIARFLARNPQTNFVAVQDTRIVGAIMAGHDGRRGFIYHTAVAEDWRRQGIAARLVDAAMAALARCGISKVALVAFTSNEAGNAFWEAEGFTVRNDLTYRNRPIAEFVRYDT